MVETEAVPEAAKSVTRASFREDIKCEPPKKFEDNDLLLFAIT